MDKTNVVIIEDYNVIRETFVKIINSTPDFNVMVDFESCEDALAYPFQEEPDLLLMDIQLPGMNGIEGIKLIKNRFPQLIISVVSVHENSKYVFEALSAGAVGYLTKTSNRDELISALHQMKSGGAPMSISIARMVVESFHQKPVEELTVKENGVLNLLARGKSYATIAKEMNVSLNTIKFHIRNIYEKLHVTNKSEIMDLMNKHKSEN